MTSLFNNSSRIPVCFNENYGVTLSKWLICQLKGFTSENAEVLSIDVGAYKGDFFSEMIKQGIVTGAYLFEPNPQNVSTLRDRYCTKNVVIEEMAVGEKNELVSFFFERESDGSTGSVLQRIGTNESSGISVRVNMTTLDQYTHDHGIIEKVSILKIDSQGSDLSVLHGSLELLRRSQPLVVTELMFKKSYENQCSPNEIMQWMADHGYQIGGIFDEHFSNEGWLSWCDVCFLPSSRMTPYSSPYNIRQGESKLTASNKPLVENPIPPQNLFQKLFNSLS